MLVEIKVLEGNNTKFKKVSVSHFILFYFFN